MDLLYFLKVLFRKKWIIIGLSFIAVVITFLLLVNKKPIYTSLAQYSTGFTAEKVKLVDGTSAVDIYTVDIKFDNVIETIKSPQVINRISYALMLHDLTNPEKAYRTLTDKQKKEPVYKEVNPDTARTILAQKLATNQLLQTDIEKEELILKYLELYKFDYFSLLELLSVNRVARTDYLDIAFNDENPYLAATVVNSIGNEFLNYYKGLNLRRTNENQESIKSLLENQQKKVDSLSQTLLNEKISQGTIDPVSRTTSAMETVTQLESRLADEKGKYNEHKNRYDYLFARLNQLKTSAGVGGNNEEVIRLTKRKNELVAELASKGGNDVALEKQIADLRTEINQKSNGGGSNKLKLNDQIDELNKEISEENALLNAAKSNIEDYEGRIRKYMGMTNASPGSEVKMDVIRTKLEMENKQLGNVKELYNQVEGLAKDDPTANFIQTRVGQPAAEPNSKKTLVKMMLAGISVFFLLAVFFIFLEIFDSSVKTPGIFSKLAKAKISTVINQIDIKKQDVSNLIIADAGGKSVRKNVVFKNNVRKLRYELMNSGKQVFLFTSTQAKTGKSVIIEALATSLLLSKKKVLIIDMNFSNNSLTRHFGTDIYIQDVAQKLNYAVPASQLKIVGKTKQDGLYIIGCREANSSPAEALYNIEMTAFFDYLKPSFDYVLIEGASLNNYSDSREIAKNVEGIFTVFAADASVQLVDQESLRFIAETKEKNHGVILNKVLTENINS
jgi:uncharacterized protein involved in exopolysaccharide biosynthesis/Mrp family chromosome partitioning ATPase